MGLLDRLAPRGAARPVPVRLLRDPGHLLALGFGAGLAPVAPGTFGTLVGIGLYALLLPLDPAARMAALALIVLGGVWLCARTARALGVHDHGAIVWDEVAGIQVSLVGVAPEPLTVLAGFVLFRLFDVVKPWPIRSIDRRLGGGWGIMLDDIMAGIYSSIVLNLVLILGVLKET